MQTFKCLLICSINHEDIFIVCVWMMINTITMLLFANYLLGMNENQTSISEKSCKQHTLRSNQNEKRKKRNNQRKKKGKLHTQKQELKNK
jgi:Mg2+/citrate symporter